MQQIVHITTSQLATIIAGLVREGLTFECHPGTRVDEWTITLLGGF